MKKFLKKANRGLILGSFVLILLVIYIIIDYSSFSSEKPIIKTTLENYISNFYDDLSQNDYTELKKLVNDSWTPKPVVSSYYNYFHDKTYALNSLSDSNNSLGNYGEISYEIKKVSVKKSGPNMAYAQITFKASVENNNVKMALLDPFCSFDGYWYDKNDDDDSNKNYVYDLGYEYELYLRKEDGEWKISQVSGYNTDISQHLKEEE